MYLEFEYEEEKAAYFDQNYTRTKDELLNRIRFAISKTKSGHDNDVEHSVAYYKRLLDLLERFKKKVEDCVLFENLEDWWMYGVNVDVQGATLLLQHVKDADFLDENSPHDPDDGDWLTVDQDFKLLHIDTRLLTLDEYAEIYGVNPGTVRQWIRRGKIPSAVKYGREWRVPELAELPRKARAYASYEWKDKLSELPEEYQFMNDYVRVTITHWPDKNGFRVVFLAKNREEKELDMDVKEKERFELMLISNPLIKPYNALLVTI